MSVRMERDVLSPARDQAERQTAESNSAERETVEPYAPKASAYDRTTLWCLVHVYGRGKQCARVRNVHTHIHTFTLQSMCSRLNAKCVSLSHPARIGACCWYPP